jgi:hypothetical protein
MIYHKTQKKKELLFIPPSSLRLLVKPTSRDGTFFDSNIKKLHISIIKRAIVV